jgi:hypothetical protein
VKKFPALCRIWRFSALLKSSRHSSLSWARRCKSTPSHLTALRSIRTLSSHQRLGLPSVPFSFVIFDKSSVFISALSHACKMNRPPHSPSFHCPTNIWRGSVLMKRLFTLISWGLLIPSQILMSKSLWIDSLVPEPTPTASETVSVSAFRYNSARTSQGEHYGHSEYKHRTTLLCRSQAQWRSQPSVWNKAV